MIQTEYIQEKKKKEKEMFQCEECNNVLSYGVAVNGQKSNQEIQDNLRDMF